MPEPLWVKLLGIFLPGVLTLLAILIGRATQGGVDKNKLDKVCGEVEELQAARIEQGSTLAAHNAKHLVTEVSLADIQATVKATSSDVAYIRGLLETGRRRSGPG